jgi:ribokinase
MNAAVTVLGSANMDLVVRTGRLPTAGETVLGDQFSTIGGGKGANQAVAAARAGANCRFIAAVGDDANGVALLAGLRRSGVDVELVRTVAGASGVALIAVDDAGENQIVVAPGANGALLDLGAADIAAITDADVLVCQLEVPIDTVTAAAEVARAGGTRVLLNAAPARLLPEALLGRCDLIVVNQTEAAELSGATGDPDTLADALLKLVPRVALTLGAAGVLYAEPGSRLRIAAPVVRAVDTTAAGDAFVGALAVAWAEDRPMARALKWACAAGAAAAGEAGASDSLPDRRRIDELFAATYPDLT